MRLFFFLILFIVGCANPAFEYAKARHQGCKVSLLEETRDNVRVLVECPGSDPFEQTFRKR